MHGTIVAGPGHDFDFTRRKKAAGFLDEDHPSRVRIDEIDMRRGVCPESECDLFFC